MDIESQQILDRGLRDTRETLRFRPWQAGALSTLLWLGTTWLWSEVVPIPGVGSRLNWVIGAVAAASIVFVAVLAFSLAAAPYRIERDRRRNLREKYRDLHGIARELRETLKARLIDLESDLHVEAESPSVRLRGPEIDGENGASAPRRWMFLVDGVSLRNRSDTSSLSLDVYLSVPRKDEASRSDDLVLRENSGAGFHDDREKVEWLKSPIRLEPGDTASGHLGFWVPIWAIDDAEDLGEVETDESILRFHDHISGQTIDRRLRDCVQR